MAILSLFRNARTVHSTSKTASDVKESEAAILDAIARAKALKLCLRRIWAVASSLPGRAESLPTLIPPFSKTSVPGHDRQHHEHEQCTFDFCEYSRVDFTSVAQRHEKCDSSCDQIVFPLQLLDGRVKRGKSTAWKLDDTSFLGESQPYMAISHVWADGTGVGTWGPGKVNKCLYDFFCEIARHFQCEGCWWDTIGIPSNAEYRSKALNTMQENYADARITLVHDLYLREWEWVDAETACFAIVMSPWYSRGWTALELAKSHKVKILFKARPDGYTLKDLDVDILSQSSNAAAKSIRMLRSASIQGFGDLLAILGPRDTSKPRDVPIISGLLAGVDVSGGLSQQAIYQRILRKLGSVAQGHLFHNSATMSVPGFSWCPTNILDMPAAEDNSALLNLKENGDLEGIWKVFSIDSVKQDDFIWRGTHPLTQVSLESALGGKSKENHLLLVENGVSRSRALLVKLMRNEETTKILRCRFVGPVYFRSTLDGSNKDAKFRNFHVVIGSTETLRELQGKAWDLVIKMDERNKATEEVYSLEDTPKAVKLRRTLSLGVQTSVGEDDSLNMRSKNWKCILYLRGDAPYGSDQLFDDSRKLLGASESNSSKESERKPLEEPEPNFPREAESKSPGKPDADPPREAGPNQPPAESIALYFVPDDLGDNTTDPHATCQAFFYGNQDIATYVKTSLNRTTTLRNGRLMLLVLDEEDQIKHDSDDTTALGSLAGDALLHAVENGTTRKVESLVSLLLESGAQHKFNSSGRSPLHLAVEHGYAGIVEKLLTNETNAADPDAASAKMHGETAIHMASKKSYKFQIVELLIKKSKDLDRRDKTGRTALHLAAGNGQLRTAQLLLERGADSEAVDSNQRKPLHYAASKGHNDIVTALLEHVTKVLKREMEKSSQSTAAREDEIVDNTTNVTTNVETKEKPGEQTDEQAKENSHPQTDGEAKEKFHSQSDGNNDEKTARLKRGEKAKPDSPDVEGQTPLHLAAQGNHAAVVETLIHYGAKVSAVNKSNQTPMLLAAKMGRHAVVETLFNMDRQSFEQEDLDKALLLAATGSHIQMITELHKAGARSGLQDPDGMTALHRIIRVKEEHTALLLIETLTNVEAKDRLRGQSILLLAADKGLRDVVVKLLKNGADVKSRDSNRRTALHRAAINRNVDIIKHLLSPEGQSVIDEEDSQKRTALHWAALSGSADAVGHILESGANPYTRDQDGRSALILAAAKGHAAAVDKLLDKSDLKAYGEDRKTALDWAATQGSDEAVRSLVLKIELLPRTEADEAKQQALEMAADKGHLSVAMSLRDSIKDSALQASASQRVLFSACTFPEITQILDELLESITEPNQTDKQGRTALMLAVKNINHHLTTKLLSLKVDTNSQDADGMTALMMAAKPNSSDLVESLLEAGANPDMQDSKKCTALHHAIESGSRSCLRSLLSHKANPNIPDSLGRTPLHMAAEKLGYNHKMGSKRRWIFHLFTGPIVAPQIDKNLIDLRFYGARPDIKDKDGQTPLYSIIRKNREDLLQFLLEDSGSRKFDIDTKDAAGQTPLLLAAEKGYSGQVEFLLTYSLKPNVQDNKGQTPLLLAAANGDVRSVYALLRRRANPNLADTTRRTPLLLAAHRGDSLSAEALLEGGADPNVQDETGRTPLLLAAQNGHDDVVKVFPRCAKVKINVDTRDNMGQTALLVAAENGHAAIAMKLVELGADSNIEDNNGKKAWWKAMDKGHASVVASLPSEPLTISDRNAVNEALLLASRKGWTTMVDVLLRKDADITFQSEEGWTALHMAVMSGHQEVVKSLLQQGVGIIIRDKKGRTALMQATEHGFESIVGLLLEREEVQTDMDGWMGQDALLFAAEKGYTGIVKLLLERSTKSDTRKPAGNPAGNPTERTALLKKSLNCDVKDQSGRTAMALAAANGNKIIVELLLKKNASPTIRDNQDRSALHHAAWGGYDDIVELLQENGGEFNSLDSRGQSALHLAAERASREATERLLGTRHNVNARSKDGQTPLHRAAWGGSREVTMLLLDHGADPSIRDNSENKPWQVAAEKGHESIVEILLKDEESVHEERISSEKGLIFVSKRGYATIAASLLRKGVDLEVRDRDGLSPLHWAAGRGDEALVRLLIEKIENLINALDPKRQTALCRGVLNGRSAVVKLLLKSGADANIADETGRTALHHAAQHGNWELVQILANHEADPHIRDREREKAWQLAAKGGYHHIVRFLMESEIDLNPNSQKMEKLLLEMAERGLVRMVQLLLEKGVDKNTRDRHGRVAIGLAAEHGRDEVLRLLLSKGADRGIPDSRRQTPLLWAARAGNAKMINMLLDKVPDKSSDEVRGEFVGKGDDAQPNRTMAQSTEKVSYKAKVVNHRDSENRTALLIAIDMAIEEGYDNAVKLLLDKGSPEIDVDVQDIIGRTALQLAAERGKQNLVQLLLSCGATQNLPDNLGRTALLLSAEQGHDLVVETLLENSAECVDAYDSQGRTALQVVTEQGDQKMIEALLRNGANVNHQDQSGRTALLFAAEDGNKEIVDLLLKHKANHKLADLESRTPFSIAIANGDQAVVKALIEYSKSNPSAEESKGPVPAPALSVPDVPGENEELAKAASGVMDSQDLNLLQLAVRSGNKEVVWLVASRMTST